MQPSFSFNIFRNSGDVYSVTPFPIVIPKILEKNCKTQEKPICLNMPLGSLPIASLVSQTVSHYFTFEKACGRTRLLTCIIEGLIVKGYYLF